MREEGSLIDSSSKLIIEEVGPEIEEELMADLITLEGETEEERTIVERGIVDD